MPGQPAVEGVSLSHMAIERKEQVGKFKALDGDDCPMTGSDVVCGAVSPHVWETDGMVSRASLPIFNTRFNVRPWTRMEKTTTM